MYYLFFILCYLLIRPNSSYVLLAANMEDFRTLAKKLVPGNVANQFISMATVPALRQHPKHIQPIDSHEPSPSHTEEEEEVELKHKHKHAQRTLKHKRPTKKTTSAFDVQLDELVARVKESLQKDWSLFFTTPDWVKYTINSKDDDYATTERNTRKLLNSYEAYTTEFSTNRQKLQQIRYIKQSRDDTKNKHREKNRNVGDARYVETNGIEEAEVLQQQTKFLNAHKQTGPQPTRFKKTSSKLNQKQRINKKRQRLQREKQNKDAYLNKKEVTEATIDAADVLKEVDIRKIKDSYEDYVTPKKDDDYDKLEPVKSSNKKNDKPNNEYQQSQHDEFDKISSNVFSEVDKALNNNNDDKLPDENNDSEKKNPNYVIELDKGKKHLHKKSPNGDETINYNQKKRMKKPHIIKQSKGKNYYTPDQSDNMYVTTTEMPTSRKWTNDYSEYNNNHDTNHEPHKKIRHKPLRNNKIIKPSRNEEDNPENGPDDDNGPKRMVEVHDGSLSEVVAAPSSMYLGKERQMPPGHGAPKNSHDIEKERKTSQQQDSNEKDVVTGTEDALHIFKGFDMLKIKDSYEDYVTPRRDEDLFDGRETKSSKNDNFNLFKDEPNYDDENDRKSNIEDNNFDKKKIETDYETINYNKKSKNGKFDYKTANKDKNNKFGSTELKMTSDLLPLPTESSNLDLPIAYAEQIGLEQRRNDDLFQKGSSDGKMRAERFLLEEKIKENKYTFDDFNSFKNKFLK